MIYRDVPVGAIWVALLPTEYLLAPSLHIMIGDAQMRGKGLGSAACVAVVNVLSEEYREVYTRYLLSNEGSEKLMRSLGFKSFGSAYRDKDGLSWQNLSLKI
jgi:RimJ/RimL family protein N-acetyltransferase